MKYIPVIIILTLFILAAFLSAEGEVSRPSGPVIFAGTNNQIEIYWFYPGLYESSPGNIKNPPDNFGALTTKPGSYSVMTHFNLDPPVLVYSARTFIAGADFLPDQPGDQFTPVTLSLNSYDKESCFVELWHRQVALDSSSCGSEQVTAGDINIIALSYDIWMGIEWPIDTAAAPFIGQNSDSPGLRQFVLDNSDDSCIMTECQSNFMAAIGLLNWTDPAGSESFENIYPDSLYFEVLFAGDTAGFSDNAELLNTVGPESLFSIIDIEKNGFIRIKANDGYSTEYSPALNFDTSMIPKIAVNPPIFNMPFDKGNLNYFDFELSNLGSEAVSINLEFDTLIVSLSVDSLMIEPGGSQTVNFLLQPGQWEDSLLSSSITMLMPDNKYPILYHLVFIESAPTDVAEIDSFISNDFSVSQPFPDPFNSEVAFRLEPPDKGVVTFEVYNILGQRIFLDRLNQTQSSHYGWPGVNNDRQKVPSGIYFFRFSSAEKRITRRAVMIK